jgi:hypothetical protein
MEIESACTTILYTTESLNYHPFPISFTSFFIIFVIFAIFRIFYRKKRNVYNLLLDSDKNQEKEENISIEILSYSKNETLVVDSTEVYQK